MKVPPLSKAVACLALVYCAFLPATGADDTPYCLPKTSTDSGPPLPYLNMNAFTVEYRVNILEKKYTMWAKEFYDNTLNKVRMDMIRNGTTRGILLDYEDDVMLTYAYLSPDKNAYSCEKFVLDIVQSDNFDMFGYTKKTGSSVPYVVSSQHILQFAKSGGQEYKGQEVMDGLTVNHWQSCHTWEDVSATFTLDYYFTTPDYKPLGPLTPRQIPVRAEVQGTIMEGGTRKRSLHHIYEYLDFRAFERLPPETFSLPEFMICRGSAFGWNKTLPSLPPSMHYLLEKVSHVPQGNGKSMVEVDVVVLYSDAERHLMRVDQTGGSSISDFSTGVEYVISQYGCVARPIDPYNVASAGEEDGVITKIDRPEMAYLKQEYHFTGEKLYRDMSTYAFTGESPNGDELLQAYISKSEKVPVGIVVKNVKTGLKTQYNFFDFGHSTTSLTEKNPFDIQRCKKSNEITEFDLKLHFKTDSKENLITYIDDILIELRDYVASIAGISVLQVSKGDYHLNLNKQEFQWYGFFLSPELDSAQANVENKLRMKTYADFLKLVSDVIFANQFLKQIEFDSGFSITVIGERIHSKSHSSSISVHDNPLNRFAVHQNFCTRSFKSHEKARITDSVYECSQACLKNKMEACKMFQYVKTTKQCTLSWQDTIPDLIRTEGCNFYVLNYLAYFEAFPGLVLVKDNNAVYSKASSAEACAKLCVQENKFNCQSLDYCEDEARCQLYDTHFYHEESNPSSGEEYKTCVHYSRKHLDAFKTIRSTDVSLPDQAEVKASNIHECAYTCTHDPVGCKMFSSCHTDQGILCKFVSDSYKDEIKVKHDDNCNVYKAHNVTKSIVIRGGGVAGGGYSGGAMFGVAVAMILTGIGIGLLTQVLLHRFQV